MIRLRPGCVATGRRECLGGLARAACAGCAFPRKASPRRRIVVASSDLRAMALKPIAKTMSMSFKIAAVAARRKVPCFCADLTVNPVLVEWNRAVAERLPQFPGLGDLVLLESNGAQNYRNWAKMREDVPQGGLFARLPRYEKMFAKEAI